MSFQEEIFDKIEAYLSGDLDAGEEAAFESQISTDDLLKAEVEKHKVANALIMEQRLLSVKNILQEERLRDSNSNNSKGPLGYVLLAVATIGIGAAIWMVNKEEVALSTPKEDSTTNQIVTSSGAENKIAAENQSAKDALKSTISTTDNGFHKQQIQQIEEQKFGEAKNSLDAPSVVQKDETAPPSPQIKTPSAKPSEPVASNPCSNVTIQATVKGVPTCSHETTGNILVSNIQGGVKPYVVSILNSHKESVQTGLLEADFYTVYIMDANTCEKIYSNVQIIEKECPIDYSFNPFIGEKWQIESYITEGQLEIYNKGGVLHYKETLDANRVNEWTGTGFNNQTIPGYYIFVIKYTDGTSKRGSVTIVQ